MFRCTQKEIDNILVLELAGPLDEDAELPKVDCEKYEKVRVNTKKIDHINSCGIRLWLSWIQPLTDMPIDLVECPKVFIDKVTMISNFITPNFHIESFEIPYYCQKCDESYPVFESNTGKNLQPKDSCPCPVCGENAEIDVFKQKYLAFLVES